MYFRWGTQSENLPRLESAIQHLARKLWDTVRTHLDETVNLKEFLPESRCKSNNNINDNINTVKFLNYIKLPGLHR